MKKILRQVFELILMLIKDIYGLIKLQERCDIYDMLQIISFGLLINALYGVMKDLNGTDVYITLMTSYAIMRLRKDMKEHKC